jgi:hypothetical protein
MGYCMSLMEENFFIPAKLKAKALKAIKALAGSETITDAGGRHFSWVDHNFSKKKTLMEAMDAWRWSITEDEEGNVTAINFDGEKLGDDAILFAAIGPFVLADSFIQMQGEDGSMWRYSFDGKKMHEDYPDVTWPQR